MKPLTFTILRLLSHDEFRSGEDIAAATGVSRASVCNALNDLGALGVEVYRLPGRGYRLAQPIEWLNAHRLAELVGDRYVLTVLDVTESTNSRLLAQAAEGAPHRSCLVAEVQTQGRGRRGRRWESTLGGSLTFSVLWRFEQGVAGLSGLSLAVGVALHRAIRGLGVAEVRLKWPNDLLYRHQKLGGILVELQGDALGPAAAVIGVGLNLSLGSARDRIDQAVTDLGAALGQPPPRNALLASVLHHLDQVLTRFETEGFAALREEWEAAHAHQGRQVSLLLPSGERVEGRVEGVTEDGALRLRVGDRVRRFASGEVSLRPATAAAGE